MNSSERVMAAIEFRLPDRLPRWDAFDIFGSFPQRWRAWRGVTGDANPADYYQIDIGMVMSDEGPFFSLAQELRQEGAYQIVRDGWGRTIRQAPGQAYFMKTLETVLDDPANLDRLKFEDPADDLRFDGYLERIASERQVGRLAFSKVGGIYCRAQFMRREDRLLVDMATDPGFCRALFERVADHLTRVALEELRRTDSWGTGMWVYDDFASSQAPMFSPAMWEQYLLPRYARMIETLRAQGCQHVFFHSDGNIGPTIELLLEAGFEGFNPLEPRTGLDLVKLRKQYGKRIIFFGGICNTQILPSGDKEAIEKHVRPLIELGRDGGLVIGSASIGDDIAPETYDYYSSLLDRYACYT